MSAMKEHWRKVIELWKTGGQRGVRLALDYLMSLGYERKEAKEQLAGAIKIYRDQEESS